MLFVDTGVWYAALDRADVSHVRAVEILGDGEELVTSDYVLVETWRLAAHRLGFEVAERFWQSLRRGSARLETVQPVDREAAFDRDFAIYRFGADATEAFGVVR